MPRIKTGARRQPSLGELRHTVIVCTTVERPDEDVSVILQRPEVFQAAARVLPLKGSQMLHYRAVLGDQYAPTHEVTLRVPPDVRVDLNHWVQHVSRTASVWYRVRTVEDLGGVGRFLMLMCSVDQADDRRFDPATQMSPPPDTFPSHGSHPVPELI